LEKPIVPPSYAATAHGKEGFVDTFGFSDAGVTNAAELLRFAQAHKHLDTTASPSWKSTKIDGLTAVSTTYTDADKPSFIAYVLAKNGNVVRFSCFPKVGSTEPEAKDLCPSVLKTIKVGDVRTS